MNAHATKRRAKLVDLLYNPDKSIGEQFEIVFDFLEEQVRDAYRRGYHDGAGKSDQRDRKGVSL